MSFRGCAKHVLVVCGVRLPVGTGNSEIELAT